MEEDLSHDYNKIEEWVFDMRKEVETTDNTIEYYKKKYNQLFRNYGTLFYYVSKKEETSIMEGVKLILKNLKAVKNKEQTMDTAYANARKHLKPYIDDTLKRIQD